MKIRILYFIIITLFLSSCNTKTDTIRYIDIKKTNKRIDSEQIVNSEQYVKLQTNNECLIGEIIDIKLYKDFLYVLEQTGSLSRILVFDLEGNFKYQLGSYGRGPEEIDNPRSFCFKDSSVFVWDKSVHHLKLNNQYVKKMFECFEAGAKFEIWNGKFVFLHGPMENEYISLVDMNGKTIDKLKLDDIHCNLGCSDNDMIIKSNGNIILYSTMLDKIYTLKENDLLPIYKTRYGNMGSLSDVVPKKSVSPYELLKIINKPGHCINYKYFETNDLIFINCHYNRKLISTILYKNKWETKSFASLYNSKLKTDVSPDFMIDDNTFCKVLNLYEFINKEDIDADFKDLIDDSRIDDNPVLFMYNFKRK